MDTDNNSVVDPDMDTSGQLDDSETGDDDFLPTKQQMHSKRSKHKSHERSISKKQKKANGVRRKSNGSDIRKKLKKSRKQKKKKRMSGSKGDEFYKKKFRGFAKRIKEILHENAAMADEIDHLQEKLITGRAERKYLLKRLFQYKASRLDQGDSMSAANLPFNVSATTHLPDDFVTPYMARVFLGTEISKSTLPIPPAKSKGKRKIKKLTLEDINNVLMKGTKAKTKKSKSTVKVPIEPIELDASGKPVIPIVINDLRVHSLGKIIHDKDSYHTETFIYPVGYCSSRSYPSTATPTEKTNYMSTISEGDTKPKFEISLEDGHDVIFQASSPDACVAKLNKVITEEMKNLPGNEINFTALSGPEFFGFSIPVIQNLIQNCPGAKKCSKYNWIRFEVKKKSLTSLKENKADHEDKPVKTTDEDKQDDASHSDSKIDGSKLEQPASPKLNDIAKQDSSESDNDKLMIELDSL